MVEIQHKDLAIVKKILRLHVPSFEVRAFGSRVHKKNLKPFSDLDIVIMTSTPLAPNCLGHLQEDFSQSVLPFKVDVVDWSEISDSFRQVIDQDFEVIHEPAPRI